MPANSKLLSGSTNLKRCPSSVPLPFSSHPVKPIFFVALSTAASLVKISLHSLPQPQNRPSVWKELFPFFRGGFAN
ncbi:hypothetical protein Ancab_000880 [Ancistrocladus abbreviatus]